MRRVTSLALIAAETRRIPEAIGFTDLALTRKGDSIRDAERIASCRKPTVP